MAIRKKGRAPAAKNQEAETSVAVLSSPLTAKAKLTISVKRRMANGDEIFIAPGVELDCSPDDLDTTQEAVTERVNSWMDGLLEAYPDTDPIDAEEEEAEEAEEEEGEEGEELTEEDVKAMKKADLEALAEEYDFEFEETTVAKMRKEALEILFAEESEEEEGEEEEEAEEGEEELWSEEELEELELKDLQEIVDGWELKHPTIKKGTKLAAKKAKYVEYILSAQEE